MNFDSLIEKFGPWGLMAIVFVMIIMKLWEAYQDSLKQSQVRETKATEALLSTAAAMDRLTTSVQALAQKQRTGR